MLFLGFRVIIVFVIAVGFAAVIGVVNYDCVLLMLMIMLRI